MKIFDVLINLATLALTAVGLLFWAFIVFRVVRYPENHVGWNVLYAEVLFLALAAVSLYNSYFLSSRMSMGIATFAVASSVLVFVLYQFNILVPYEIWLERGMPPRPF